jgi:serine phosphatase RsbU (regulator of sigma subunit)
MKHVFAILFLFFPLFVFSQEDELEDFDVCQMKVDSMLSLITPDTPDSVKMFLYYRIGVFSDNTDTAIKYAGLSLQLCESSDYKFISDNNYNIGVGYYMQDKIREALPYFFKAREMFAKNGYLNKAADADIAIGKCYHELNFPDSSLVFLDSALVIYTELKDTVNITYAYQSIGTVNMDLNFHETAKEYFEKALHLDSVSENYLDFAYDCQQLGFVEKEFGNLNGALSYLTKSSCIFDTIPTDNQYYIQAKYLTYLYLSDVYITCAETTRNVVYADSCYGYVKKIGNYFFSNNYNGNQFSMRQTYARYLSFLGRDNEALEVLTECRKYLEDDRTNGTLSTYYGYLTAVYKKLGDYKNALEASDKMYEYKASFINDSTMKMVAKFQAEQEVKIHKAETAAKQHQMRIIIVSLAVGLVLITLLVFYIVKMLNIKRKANKDLTEVNNKLFSSINYAKRIQNAAISPKSEIDTLFPENFVFYSPRNIVSGDYYLAVRCGKYRVMITADCTGHGIPGAFLSMLGISALKEFCVTEDDAAAPGTILDRMRNFIKSTLVSDGRNVIGDGMDMTICCFDFEDMELRYAAANQTVVLIRDGKAVCLGGDRMPVGRYIVEKDRFSTFVQPLEKGDIVYAFSDGIQDQLGGVDGRKLLFRNLVAFLTKISSLPLEKQCRLLKNSISEWQGGRPQVDDMTMVGIRV